MFGFHYSGKLPCYFRKENQGERNLNIITTSATNLNRLVVKATAVHCSNHCQYHHHNTESCTEDDGEEVHSSQYFCTYSSHSLSAFIKGAGHFLEACLKPAGPVIDQAGGAVRQPREAARRLHGLSISAEVPVAMAAFLES